MSFYELLEVFMSDGLSLVISISIMIAYEGYLIWMARVSPLRVARTAHGEIRARWVAAMMEREGKDTEVLVIQTIRNSIMAASFMASTSALALTGTLTLSGLGNVQSNVWHAGVLSGLQVSTLVTATKLVMLTIIFFASFMFCTMSVRYFSHTGYLIGTEINYPQHRRQALAITYLNRAGYQYSLGLRAFFLCIPLLISLFSTWLMVPATLFLIVMLYRFDRIPSEWFAERRAKMLGSEEHRDVHSLEG